ncbi:Putative uncharacterized protein ART2 [Vanrija pseudolonga]|uniref:Senescence-associated protein n=1 Tax=Vanrija pseudolonga TaxID=143232 RepID=A0AAF1BS95_9TREE|nr:Putative uncharacterized protein ART2 [Vanrija pseudolonga]
MTLHHSRSLLVGEQSNAYRILLRYDRKSRHRRIKKHVAMNAWLPQASYPCGNFSGTSSLKFRGTKGSIGHTFMVCIHTENQNQGGFYPFVLLEISVLHEPPLGHLRYLLTDVPPQPNSPPDNVFNPDQPVKDLKAKRWDVNPSSASLNK